MLAVIFMFIGMGSLIHRYRKTKNSNQRSSTISSKISKSKSTNRDNLLTDNDCKNNQ